MTTLAIAGEADALALAGLEGSFEWGTARCAPDAEGDVVVRLGAPDGRPADVVWSPEPVAAGSAARLIAPAGGALWSRSLWPARDELFELEPPAPGAAVLVVAGDAQRRERVAARLAERDVPATAAPALTRAALEHAATVAFLPDEEDERPLPGPATAVLAAGRLLIAPRTATTFGLLPGTDHLAAGTEDDVVQYAHALHRFPAAMRPIAAMGRLSAKAHRASAVYERLIGELA